MPYPTLRPTAVPPTIMALRATLCAALATIPRPIVGASSKQMAFAESRREEQIARLLVAWDAAMVRLFVSDDDLTPQDRLVLLSTSGLLNIDDDAVNVHVEAFLSSLQDRSALQRAEALTTKALQLCEVLALRRQMTEARWWLDGRGRRIVGLDVAVAEHTLEAIEAWLAS